jgi:very-short-patch-repair endonuclease
MRDTKAAQKYQQTHDQYGNYKPLEYKSPMKRKKKKATTELILPPKPKSTIFPEHILQYVKENIANMTKWERITHELLDSAGVEHSMQVPVLLAGKYYIMDFLIQYEGMKICLEIDGYFHMSDDAKAKDRIRDRRMRKTGYRVIRMNDRQIEKSPETLLDKLEFLGIPIPAVS